MRWHSIHVYYYRHDKTTLLLEGVRPLFRSLAGLVDAAYWTRHWRRGPHLRLNFRTTPAIHSGVVRPAVDDIVGGFLAAAPSDRVMDPHRELVAHRRLAELEQDDGPLLPWHPDNTIVEAPYDARSAATGGPRTAELVAGFLTGSTDLAFRMAERCTGGRERLAIAFDLMVATADAFTPRGIADGFISFRSHAEGFLHGYPEAAGLRPAWDRHSAAHRDVLRRRMTAVVGAGHDVPFLRDWKTVTEPVWQAAGRLADDGELTLPTADDTDVDPDALSPFHRALHANPAWSRTQRSASFLRYRLMLNLTYLTLTRIGVTPAERFLLGHLVADTAEDLFGVRAVDLVRGPAGVR